MGRRYRLKDKPAAYVERDRKGQFKDWTGINRSIRADTPRFAKNVPSKPGHGHEGDYQYKGIKLQKRTKRLAHRILKGY